MIDAETVAPTVIAIDFDAKRGRHQGDHRKWRDWT